MDNFEMCWAKHPKYTHTWCRLKKGHKGVHVEPLPHKTIKWGNTEAKPEGANAPELLPAVRRWSWLQGFIN